MRRLWRAVLGRLRLGDAVPYREMLELAREHARLHGYDTSVRALIVPIRTLYQWRPTDSAKVERLASELKAARAKGELWPEGMPVPVCFEEFEGIYEPLEGYYAVQAAKRARLRKIPILVVDVEAIEAMAGPGRPVPDPDVWYDVLSLDSPEMAQNQDLRRFRGDLE